MKDKQCFHCGDPCSQEAIKLADKFFCCNGCKTVYEIFSENNLTCYYDFQKNPGAIPMEVQGKYDFLSSPEIVERLLDFDDEQTQVVTVYIPHIHCSSCIWVLENLHKLQPAIVSSQVNFPKKKVRITYNATEITLQEVVLQLSAIGYEPYISLEDYTSEKKPVDRSLYYKLGVAGFAYGNVMFLSFPEYFETTGFWLEQYKVIFRGLMLLFSLPVVFYAAQGYFLSAYKGLRSKILNIDVPIALGILVLFVRSLVEIVLNIGTGFLDSLTGLVFFLLVGKFFQQKTYSFLSFERDYTSYFPIAVTRVCKDGTEEVAQIYDVEKGDRLLIRNQELIPVDGVLINGNAQIDYSFVTGEAIPVEKKSGDKLFAGGKQLAGVIEMEVLSSVSESYVTQLWSNDVFKKENTPGFKTLTDGISKHFTIAILSIAFLATGYWLLVNPTKALNVFTAVLIIACPCAIALAAPFTLGNILRIFGKQQFYLKNAQVIERLAAIDTFIFDKTGTLTTAKNNEPIYQGIPLGKEDRILLKSVLKASNHPLSRILYASIKEETTVVVSQFKEEIGAGISARYGAVKVKAGSAEFVGHIPDETKSATRVYISIDGVYKGVYAFKNRYRKGLKSLFYRLHKQFKISIVSGDNAGEKNILEQLLPQGISMLFLQQPSDKLVYVKKLQEKENTVAMIGDGLNDAGALAQSNVGIALSEYSTVFSPACDAILDASKFDKIADFVQVSKKAVQIIKYCFVLSLLYNSIGLYFAVTGHLTPVVAAILMPISSISIVLFTTIASNYIGRTLKK